jgi:hypothetical protein
MYVAAGNVVAYGATSYGEGISRYIIARDRHQRNSMANEALLASWQAAGNG